MLEHLHKLQSVSENYHKMGSENNKSYAKPKRHQVGTNAHVYDLPMSDCPVFTATSANV